MIYGSKTIKLKTIDLPIACTNCGHVLQRLQIKRKYLSACFLPIIPLRKKGVVSCPGCDSELKEKSFLKGLVFRGLDSKEAESLFKSVLKAARSPWYAHIMPFLLIVIIGWGITMEIHDSQQAKIKLENYLNSPVANALALIESKDDAYPYQIAYIATIHDQNAVVFDWKYSYETRSDANGGMTLARKAIDKNMIKANFTEPYIISLEVFDNVGIVRVMEFKKPVNWKQLVPSEDPEEILKIFP